MIATFFLTVMYTQIVVRRTGLNRPGLLWDDDHVAQGFAWDDEIVSFGVPDHDGECLLEVDVIDKPESIGDAALWAIQVPYRITTGSIDVGTIADMHTFGAPVGEYALTFSVYPGSESERRPYTYKIRLAFHPEHNAEFRILKKGVEPESDKILRSDAKRA